MVAIHLPESHRAARMNREMERLEFWTEYGRGTLPSDALVCLAHCAPTGGRPAEQSLQPLVFGTTARREPKELAKKHPLVGIAFDRGQAAEHLLTRFGEVGHGTMVLVQVCFSICWAICWDFCCLCSCY